VSDERGGLGGIMGTKPSKQTLDSLFEEDRLPGKISDKDLETFTTMQKVSGSDGKDTSFTYSFKDLNSRTKGMNPEQKKELIRDCYGLFKSLMERYNDLKFAVYTLGYLHDRTKGMQKEERERFTDKAHDFFGIVAGYNEPLFARNFFSYLFEKTQGMQFEDQKQFIYIAADIFSKFKWDVGYIKFNRDIENGNLERVSNFINSIGPESRISEDLGLGIESSYYMRVLHGSINWEIRPMGIERFIQQRTVADCIEYTYKDWKKRPAVKP